MPKVMFRPNPTPPPFVPPTPPEPTNIVVLSKYPFEAYESVFVYFKNMEVPTADVYSFDVYNNNEHGWSTVNEFEYGLPSESNPYEASFDIESANINGYRLDCFVGGVSIKTIPLIVQTA